MRVGARLLAGLVIHLAVAGDSAACDRASSPLEDPAVAAAVADVVAIVEVKGLGGGVASAQVARPLKGSSKKGDILAIRGLFSAAEAGKGDLCSASLGEVGKKYVVMLWSKLPSASQYHLVDPVTSVKPYDAAAQTAIEQALARQHPHSAWLAGKPDVQTQLVRDPGAAPGQVSVFVLVRNVGKSALEYTRQYWPQATQSKCTLHITDASKTRLQPRTYQSPKRTSRITLRKTPVPTRRRLSPATPSYSYCRA